MLHGSPPTPAAAATTVSNTEQIDIIKPQVNSSEKLNRYRTTKGITHAGVCFNCVGSNSSLIFLLEHDLFQKSFSLLGIMVQVAPAGFASVFRTKHVLELAPDGSMFVRRKRIRITVEALRPIQSETKCSWQNEIGILDGF